jgi:hypothetical protein
VLAPTFTVFDASTEIKLESRPTLTLPIALVEPVTFEPAAGVKTAVSSAVEAANDVQQTTVTLWPVGVTATFAHPLISSPLFVNVIAPDGAAARTLEVTVAIKVRVSFATGAFGDASRVVLLAVVTIAVGAELTARPLPPALVADSRTTIVRPTSPSATV